MAGSVNRQILLKSRPEGAPSLGNFELTETPTPEPGEGEVLMRIIYLSLDPYMRGRMSAAKSYATPAAIGHPMVGGTVGEIIKSRNPNHSVGDIVLVYGGWQEYALSNGSVQAPSHRRRGYVTFTLAPGVVLSVVGGRHERLIAHHVNCLCCMAAG